MATRERNYHRKPHTASFLQTFHTAKTEAERRMGAADMAETETPETSDAEAVAFVTGRPARPVAGRMVEIRGWSVRVEGGYVSEKQAKWMIDIAERPSVTDAMRDSLRVRLEQGFAKFAGSQFITKYKDTPTAAQHTAMVEAVAPGASEEEFNAAQAAVKTRPEVADGRYAVEHEGVLKFFKLKNGRKAGYVFLDVQASDDWHPIRNPRRIDEILALIVEAGELNAARRYGIELGKCSRCGRTLTDQTSREYGMGPECRSK